MDDFPRASFFIRTNNRAARDVRPGPPLFLAHFRPRRIYGVAVRSFRVVSRRVARINGVRPWWKSFVVPARTASIQGRREKGGLSNKWVYFVHLVMFRARNSALIMIIRRLPDGGSTSLIFRPKVETSSRQMFICCKKKTIRVTVSQLLTPFQILVLE